MNLGKYIQMNYGLSVTRGITLLLARVTGRIDQLDMGDADGPGEGLLYFFLPPPPLPAPAPPPRDRRRPVPSAAASTAADRPLGGRRRWRQSARAGPASRP